MIDCTCSLFWLLVDFLVFMVLLVLEEAVEGVEVVGGGGGKGGELEVVCVIVAGSSVASMLLSLFDLRLPVRSCSI